VSFTISTRLSRVWKLKPMLQAKASDEFRELRLPFFLATG